MKIERKSPLTARPLRNPGQSLDEEIEKIISERVLIYFISAGFAVYVAWMEWFRWLRPQKTSPIAFTIFAILVCSYCGIKIVKAKKSLRNMRLGRDGERAVGQYLDEIFYNTGARVFHDIPSFDFNIDHVIISENGVFLIETKTYSKPKRGQAVIKYSGESIKFDNGIEKSDSIIQAKAGASWLQGIIKNRQAKNLLFGLLWFSLAGLLNGLTT